jgi:outer membrane protein assembly factor BamB
LGRARTDSDQPLPAAIGPERGVLWSTTLPPGHSSPVIWGERIFVTAVRDEQLWTIGLDRGTGAVLWQVEAPHQSLEKIHNIGSHAQPSPATDGERVVSFFGSSGLWCYDTAGNELWHKSMGPFNNEFGAGTSPILVDDWVILVQDHDTDSFLMALDKRTGDLVWKVDRSEFPRNYCSPVLWEAGGRRQIVVAATLRVVGYDLETGSEAWTVRGLSRSVCATPAVGDNGTLFVAGWSAGADAADRIVLAPYDEVAPAWDADANGTIELAEVPEGPVKPRFGQVDRDKTGSITRDEYEYYRMLFDRCRNVVLAVKPGPEGEATETHVAWEYGKLVPFCASPLYYRGYVWTVKDGGIVSCLDAATGAPGKQGRLDATGSYFASPVAGDGKVYLASEQGQVTVLSAEAEWEPLHVADFGENIYATPALVDGRIYLRTVGHLYCFAAE